jgi:putative glutathione S-transferase
MGQLVNGQWMTGDIVTSDKEGSFVRKESIFRNRITADGSSGFKAEPNRYHVYFSYACPWASRVLLYLSLKELNSVISSSTVEPHMKENGWEFGKGITKDPLYDLKYLYQIYQRADSDYTGKVTVPVLWDKKQHCIVNNESSDIIRMLNSEFEAFTQHKIDYYPVQFRQEIDELNDYIYDKINNGVYKCGFAKTQEAYNQAFNDLFSALDEIEHRLSQHRFLIKDQITEADWRLFTTLVRFDPVYLTHFKCNLKRLDDYENLSNYLRDLYQTPGVKETVNLNHIKQHYFLSHRFINPYGIIPQGPIINFDRPHNRARF